MPFSWSLRNTCLFLGIFIVAFFPGAFHILLKPLLWPFDLFGAQLSPSRPILPTCGCCPPAPCFPSNALPQPVQEPKMAWFQKTFTLPSKSRGSYLITDHVVQQLPEIKQYKVGMLNLFIQHTSCALSLNENWDEDVRGHERCARPHCT